MIPTMRALALLLLSIVTAYPQAVTLPKPDAPLPPIMLAWADAQKGMADMEVSFQQN